MKQCFNCLSDNISIVAEKDRLFYFCHNCDSTNKWVINNEGKIYTEKRGKDIKHITIAAVIQKNDEVLLTRRKFYPFGLTIPSGHLHYFEDKESALKRIVTTKTGLVPESYRLLTAQTTKNNCKYGANKHEWHVYECDVRDEGIIGTESENLVWVDKSCLENKDLILPARLVLEKVGMVAPRLVEPAVEDLENALPPQLKVKSLEESIIENLPFPVLFVSLNHISFMNTGAEKLLKMLKTRNSKSYSLFHRQLIDLASKSISDQIILSSNLKNGGETYSVVSNPLTNGPTVNKAMLTIRNITLEKEKEAINRLSYQTSFAVCSTLRFSKIAKNILSQLFATLNVTSLNMMMLEGEILKTTYCQSKVRKEKNKSKQFKIGSGIAGMVAKMGRPLAIPDVTKNADFQGSKSTIPQEQSLLSMPIISSDKVFGVLNLNKPLGVYFSENEIKLATVAANRVALAFENDELYRSLNREKNNLERVLDTATDGMILLDKDMNLLFSNQAAVRIFLLEELDLKANRLDRFLAKLSARNREKFLENIKKAFLTKKSFSTQFTFGRGRRKVLEIMFNPVVEKSRCSNILIRINDITKLVIKQELVKKQVKQLTELFKISSVALDDNEKFYRGVLEKASIILDSEAVDIFSTNQDDDTGLPVNSGSEIPSLIAKIMRSQSLKGQVVINNVKNKFSNINSIKRFISVPVWMRGKMIGILYAINKPENYNSGDLKWLSIIASRLASRAESKILFTALESDRQKLKEIIENTGDGIAVFEDNLNALFWNKAAEFITGFKSFKQFVKANSNVKKMIRSLTTMDASKITEKTAESQFEINNADKQKIWLEITRSLVENDEQKFVVLVLRDISKEKELEMRNKEFVYTTTHELRTPITVIKGYLSMIINGDAGQISNKQRKYFRKIYGSTEKLVSLVEDILKTAQIDENKLEFNFRKFKPKELAKTIVTDLNARSVEKGLKLIFNEEGTENFEINADYEFTKQALYNIVDNAIKYTPRGSIVITIGKDTKNNLAYFKIKDTGIGIEKRHHQQIFEKFYRTNNSESIKAGGTGLGLFIVKNLIEKQGGSIDIISKLKEGTTIIIKLPINLKKEKK